MTRPAFYLSTLLALAFFMPAVTHAQDAPAQPQKTIDLRNPAKVEAQSAKAGPTGALKKWIDAENKMIDPLGETDKETIFILRNKHSMMQATRIVSKDIENAVESCGDANPDMKDKMEARYAQWEAAVEPILETAQKQLEKDIDNQKIVDADQFNDVLDLHDEAYEAGEKQTTKMPVSTKEACNGLLESMDRTEDNMIAILQQTLLPESAIRKRASDIEKARARQKQDAKQAVPATGSASAPAQTPPSP